MTICRPLDGTVSAQSSGVTFQSSALTPQPGERVLIDKSATQYLIVDLGSPQAVRQIGLLYHDGLTGTFNVTASNGDPAQASGQLLNANYQLLASPQGAAVDAGYRHGLTMLPGPIVARYWEFTFPAGSISSLGRIVLGPIVQPEFNTDFEDTSWGYEELSDPDKLDSGVTILVENTPEPVFEFSLSWLSEVEMEEQFNPLARLAHQGKPVMVVRDPREGYAYRHNGIFYGLLSLQPMVAAAFDMYECKGKIRSLI